MVTESKLEEKTENKSIWSNFFNKTKLKKPEYVAVLYLRKNSSAQAFEVETKKGFFVIGDTTYHIQRDCQYKMGKDRMPLLILEEEDLVPRGNPDFYKNLKSLKDFQRKSAEYQDLALKAIRHAELVRFEGRDGPKINPKVAIGIVLAIVIGYAILKGGF